MLFFNFSFLIFIFFFFFFFRRAVAQMDMSHPCASQQLVAVKSESLPEKYKFPPSLNILLFLHCSHCFLLFRSWFITSEWTKQEKNKERGFIFLRLASPIQKGDKMAQVLLPPFSSNFFFYLVISQQVYFDQFEKLKGNVSVSSVFRLLFVVSFISSSPS